MAGDLASFADGGVELYFFDTKDARTRRKIYAGLERRWPRRCWQMRALEECNPVSMDAAVLTSAPTDACRGSKQTDCLWSRADRLDAVYLRAAQAYMLISMPTGTSTIFGAFQAIRFSQVY